jgi:hypothetical protein
LSEETSLSFWKFVKPGKFELPAEPASKTAHSFFEKLFSGIGEEAGDGGMEAVQSELKSAPRSLIDWLAPYPEWEKAAASIKELLLPWLEDDTPEGNSRVIVAPYGSGLGEMFQLLAKNNNWPVLPAPDYNILRGRDFSWIENLPAKSEEPLVIPRLEAFFLRHYNGLEHLRKLIARLFHSRQRCIIGCNSWLWHYLDSAMQIRDSFSRFYYLQSLSAQDLQTLFCSLESRKSYRPTVFRQADTGSFILPPEMTGKGRLDSAAIKADSSVATFPSAFIKKLAVESRGIPLVAWSIWRNSLKLAPGEDVAEIAREVADKDAAATATAKTIWVKAFGDVELPALPADIGQAGAFLLLFLLQHDGLKTDVVFDLLSLEKDRLIGLLNRMQKAGIIVNENEVWRASWQGYPAIRRFLAEQDHLQDAM